MYYIYPIRFWSFEIINLTGSSYYGKLLNKLTIGIYFYAFPILWYEL